MYCLGPDRCIALGPDRCIAWVLIGVLLGS